MKNGYAILLLLIYSVASLGTGLKKHYCCGKLKSVTIAFLAIEKHKCSESNETAGCCKSVVEYIKVKNDQLATTELQTPAKVYAETRNLLLPWDPFLYNLLQVTVAKSYRSPPSPYNVPIHIYNCVYRI